MNGPTSSVSLSPLSSLCLLISFTEMYQLSLSHFISLLSLSLSLLHVTASLSDKTQAGASSHTTPRHVTRTRSTLSDRHPPTQPHNPTKLRPEHQATSCHATRTRSTLSDRRPPTQPHKPDLHSQIAVHQHSHTNPTHHIHNNPWPDRHATPCRRACRAIHHVIGTSHHRISLNRPTVVGFAFGFV